MHLLGCRIKGTHLPKSGCLSGLPAYLDCTILSSSSDHINSFTQLSIPFSCLSLLPGPRISSFFLPVLFPGFLSSLGERINVGMPQPFGFFFLTHSHLSTAIQFLPFDTIFTSRTSKLLYSAQILISATLSSMCWSFSIFTLYHSSARNIFSKVATSMWLPPLPS